MKEDVLEQIAEDWLQQRGYFTMHNIPFRPDPEREVLYRAHEHSVASDIDILGINPRHRGAKRVVAVCCKSWQAGLNAEAWLGKLEAGGRMYGRDAWRSFRELCRPEWNRAFKEKLFDLTGQSVFTYVICVTRLSGSASTPTLAEGLWRQSDLIKTGLGEGRRLEFVDLQTIWREVGTPNGRSQRPASSEIGRLAQLLDAAGISTGENK